MLLPGKICIFVADMGRIDPETVQRILDTANIVEVVSDFVSLKRRGANYIGLCPFHNERTPSFSVSPARGICKCFSCGEGGSPVNFLMKLESMSYNEALRWLAKKYNIEIKERELTAQEVQDAAERESLMAVNDFAMSFFENYMAEPGEGHDIGLSYFRERGINDVSIRKFHLGFSPEASTALYDAAIEKGYSEEALLKTGLCTRNERGPYDRFRGRVIYPVFTLSGRVVAFGGRTLRSDKSISKYVNSPESIIYSKKRELYGLYQARKAITKQDKCILVEGYMDVISMHQIGIENVVASSGTSLTEEQIRLIHRFTSNVTVIYDSDAAGIKASLRGIDMLLAEGMNIKVLLLPDGEDPDSYAQTHSNTEVEAYINEHETDFIRFKTNILLKDAAEDPIRRARAIADIVKSVSVIPDQITRNVYIEECSRTFGMSERVLVGQMDVFIAKALEEEAKQQQRRAAKEIADGLTNEQQDAIDANATDALTRAAISQSKRVDNGDAKKSLTDKDRAQFLAPYERELLRLLVRYGLYYLCDCIDDNDRVIPYAVYQYVEGDLKSDNIEFTSAVHQRLWEHIRRIITENWDDDRDKEWARLDGVAGRMLREGQEDIRQNGKDFSDIKKREIELTANIDEARAKGERDYMRYYLERILCSDPDDGVRGLATELADDKYVLSKVHTKYSKIETEEDKLKDMVPRAVYELKNATLTCNIAAAQAALRDACDRGDDPQRYINELMELNALKCSFASYLGERIITPTKL